jgi:hypothetical protein
MTESNPLEPHRTDRDLKVANAIRELLEREFPATDTPPQRWAFGETLEYALSALEKAMAK